MKLLTKFLPVAAIFAATLTSAFSADEGDVPFVVGESYLIAFAPVNQPANVDLPKGVAKIVGKSGSWIKVEYSTSQNQRSKADPGTIEVKETSHTAWLNGNQIVALVKPDGNTAAK